MLFKRLGIAVEIQTGDTEFDRDFYIRTNSVAFTESFFRAAEKRQAVSRLFDLKYNELRHDGAIIVATMCPFKPAKDRDELALESVVGALALLAEDPPEDCFEPLVFGTPAWKIRRRVVYAISIVSAVSGFALAKWGAGSFPPLDRGDVLVASLGYAVPALLAFVISGVAMLRGRSSSHTELMTNLTVALIGFPVFAFGATVTVNGFLDRSDPTVHRVEIIDKRVSGSGESTSRFVYVESWREGHSRERLDVGREAHDRMAIGATLRLATKPGRLGFEWIADHGIESGER